MIAQDELLFIASVVLVVIVALALSYRRRRRGPKTVLVYKEDDFGPRDSHGRAMLTDNTIYRIMGPIKLTGPLGIGEGLSVEIDGGGINGGGHKVHFSGEAGGPFKDAAFVDPDSDSDSDPDSEEREIIARMQQLEKDRHERKH